MKHAIIALTLLLSIGSVSAQQNLTLYNMDAIPQSSRVNPAKNPDSRLFIGLPVISSFHWSFLNKGLSFKELDKAFYEIPGNDSFGFNVSTLGEIFSKSNYVSLSADVDLFSFGFKIKKNYFTFHSSFNNDVRFSYPGDAFDLIFQGNGGANVGRTFDLNFGVDVLQTIETGIGYSREVTDKLTLGARVKRINGLNTISTAKNDISFQTRASDYAFVVKSDVEINSASVAGNMFDSSSSFEPSDIVDAIGKNSGWGFDFGAEYQINKKFSVHASIVDLGQIKWTTNTTNYKSSDPNAQFVFDGFDFAEIFGDSADIGESFQNLADSLADVLKLDSSGGEFTQSLFTEFYIGGNFHLNKNHNAGILFYGTWYNQKLRPGATVSWNSRLTKLFSISASASLIQGQLNNVGLGFAFNMGPVQTYVVSDNILGALNPYGSKVANFRSGLNLVFLRGKKKEKAPKENKKEVSLEDYDSRINRI